VKQHPSEAVLALYSSRDLDWRERLPAAFHIRSCERCRTRVAEYQSDTKLRARGAAAMDLPENWESLAEEMAANIRLGLSAAECVRQVPESRAINIRPVGAVRPGWYWKPAIGIAASMALLVMTLVTTQSEVFQRVWNGMRHGVTEAPAVMLQSSADGVEMRRGTRSTMRISVGDHKADQYSANLDGSVRAQYVDDDSLQVTVTNVYAQ
jgi:hypothetical protein